MKCSKCNTENKENARGCRKCGNEFHQQQLWKPDWKWHARTLGVIYAALLVAFFLFSHILKPYMRQIPKDITPWLKEMPKNESVG